MRNTFIDEVTVEVRSGNGGAGCVAFRREKFIPYGGPNGGCGGRGGDVVVRADGQLGTLLDYRFRPRHLAAHGGAGEGSQRSGRDGETAILRVPVGTVVHRVDAERPLADLDGDGAQVVVARGGRGGRGNEHFKSSTRQAPRFAQPGEPGEGMMLRLELKLLADVGLVGLPNVGKSSLVARISAARPKIADYPFTTLVPNLGLVRDGDRPDFVVADVPGLVVGAAGGAGLGSRFLRHLARVRLIAHLVTVAPGEAGRAPAADFEAIEAELAAHDPRLAAVPRLLVLGRMDLPEVRAAADAVAAFAARRGMPFFPISAATGAGLTPLVRHLGEAVALARAAALARASRDAAAAEEVGGAAAAAPCVAAAHALRPC